MEAFQAAIINNPAGVRRLHSGMVGLGKGQVVRVNVVNTAPPGTIVKRVWVQGWSNPKSELIKESEFILEPGQSAFLDMTLKAIPRHKGNRHQICATVVVLDDADAACAVTVEVFDKRTGKTSVILRVM